MAQDKDDDLDCSVGDEDFGLGNSTFNSVHLEESLDSSFDVDNEGLLAGPETSTPKKPRVFKKPKPPPEKYFRKCGLCGNYIKSERGFKQHLQTHKWKEAAQLKPPVQETVEHCKAEVVTLLDNLINKFTVEEGKAGHIHSVKITSVLKDMRANIVGSEFLDCILFKVREMLSSKSASKVMPSALRTILQSGISSALSSQEFREKLLATFMKVTNATTALAWNIIFCFMKETTDAAFIFICKKLRGPNIQASIQLSKDDFNHYLSQQVVHYIAGSCLRAHFRNAYSYPHNQMMRNIKECILLKFAKVGSPSITDRKSPQYWTSLLNRSSLLFVHEESLPFFIELCKLLQKLETPDGKLEHKRVMDLVVSTTALTTLWDGIVDNALEEDESFHFMVKVVKSMTNTFGKGMMYRRMNTKVRSGKSNKATLAVSHRARLIGKQ